MRPYDEKYLKTPKGRASNLLCAYRQADRNKGRGEGDLTAQWIVDNIFSKPCAHCGKTGWQIIGCNRLDNSKPHTKDNVEPCCRHCNSVLNGEDKGTRVVYQYTLDGKLVKIYDRVMAVEEDGFNNGTVSLCCNGDRKTHKGYKWFYEPL